MRKNYLGIAGFIFLFFVSSCKKEQVIPSYLYIPNLNTNGFYSISGSDSSEIYGAKVFLNNQLIGVYQTPVEVPLFAEGEQTIKTIAVVKKNGFPNDLIPYPYFDFSTDIALLEADKTVDLTPTVDYLSTATVDYWFEDFENPTIKFVTTDNSTGELVKTQNPELVFFDDSNDDVANSTSGQFELNNDSAYIKSLTNENFTYKKNTNVFVEINYQNNQPFFFDIVVFNQLGQVEKIPFFQFKETINAEGELYWNKIYLEIGSLLNTVDLLISFEICFEMQKDITVANSIVVIDNVKLIKDK
ncbi:MAG: hypothetical protein DRI54_04530 [Bacteroidetes bacterium]|nr:MAG: hypothetical protein DRI54_04530 [Bacteroidota bacterium]